MASWVRGIGRRRAPELSVVIVVYNIPREAERSLYALSAAYQRHISPETYEVIVVDNGSTPTVDRALIERMQGNFRLIRIDEASPSPAQAINRALAAARGEAVGVMVDGARLVTPGLLHFALHGVKMFPRAVVATLGWHLGFDTSQRLAVEGGYDRRREDALLASIDWPNDGYRLFEIAALDGSSVRGWLSPANESNALFMGRSLWGELGGLEERFDAPGGGVLNLDTFRRALELPDTRLVCLLGEATFHQLHGGVATNAELPTFRASIGEWLAQYEAIRHRPWAPAEVREPPVLLGGLPRAVLAHFVRSALNPVPPGFPGVEPPLGSAFDPGLWSLSPPVPPADPVIHSVTELAHAEFRAGRCAAAAAVARLARARAADESAPQRLLAHASPWSVDGWLPADQRAAAHTALGDAYRLLGDNERAAAEFRSALTFQADLVAAHIGLAKLRMPGPDYEAWLDRLHEALRPETYLEIGVFLGATLALPRPPTRVFAVDPEPSVRPRLKTETHIFAETSDAFFAARRLEGALAGRPLKLAFIDGLHVFEQCLRDFMSVEAWCDPTSAIVLHDMVPLDEPTQRRTQETQFWTGDVWKALLALKHYRPDLDIFTIPAAPTGLTVVTGLDPSSRVLVDGYEEAVRRFIGLPFAEVEGRLDDACNIVPNDWDAVVARLKTRAVF